MKNPLLDLDFLKKIDQNINRETFAKIISLSFDENPIEEITGKVTQGSMSVDGSSAVRRTCSLSMIADQVNLNNYYWGLNTKIKLFIGIKNDIDPQYEDIIWFPQGTYLLTSFNTSYNTSGFTISLQGKDKMCLLNGEVGGNIQAISHDFGTIDEIDENGNITNKKLKLKDIIKEAVHEYAREPYHNIIINDLDESGVELLEYRGDTPIYFLINAFTDEVENFITDGEKTYNYLLEDGSISQNQIALKDIPESKLNPLIELDTTLTQDSLILYTENGNYTVARISYGETCGYRLTDLTYAGDLIGNIGESLTSILDKIKNMLGEFEYFYNLDGKFVFQKKRTFIKTSWNNIVNNQESEYIEDAAYSSAYSYSFENGVLITAYQNSPNLLNLRNDFSIWGKKKSSEVPIHLRYAIDTKPDTYVSIVVDEETVLNYNNKYGLNAKPQLSSFYTTKTLTDESKKQLLESKEYEYGFEKVQDALDWREIIYQMSKDYLKWNHLDDFEARVYAANGYTYPNGFTRYNQYYTDINSFWRQLYNPDICKIDEPDGSNYYYLWDENTQNYQVFDKKDVVELKEVPSGIKFYEFLATSGTYKEYDYLKEFNENKEYYILNTETNEYEKYNIYNFKSNASYYNDNSFNLTTHWTLDLEQPDKLNFWFDFLDTGGELQQFSVRSVGDRPKTVNDDKVNAIYYKNVPKVLFINNENFEEQKYEKIGYTHINLPNYLEDFFFISAQGKSANDMLDEFLYNYSYCIESISLTSLPIYHLEPNTRIFVNDINSGIKGEYIVSKYTLPLTYNGTMSITATRAAESIN